MSLRGKILGFMLRRELAQIDQAEAEPTDSEPANAAEPELPARHTFGHFARLGRVKSWSIERHEPRDE